MKNEENNKYQIVKIEKPKTTTGVLKVLSASLAGVNILTVLLSKLSGKVDGNNIIINIINSDFMRNVSIHPKIYGSLIASAIGFTAVYGVLISESKNKKK